VLGKAYATGQEIRESGIYAVGTHPHLLTKEVTLLCGEVFPCCSKCTTPIEFFLVHDAPYVETGKGFKVRLYSLPDLSENQQLTSQKTA
jgi:hypothetical protein